MPADTHFHTFCVTRGLKVKAVSQGIQCDNDDGKDWEHTAWKVTLFYKGRRLTTPFKRGMAYKDAPTADSVLYSLMLDADSGERGSFEEFCSDFGYDTDSRKAETAYKACARTSKKLVQFLGDDLQAFRDASRDY